MRQSLAGATLPTDWILTCHGGTPAPLWRGKRLLSPSDAILCPVRGRPSEGRILGLWWFCLVPARLQASTALCSPPYGSPPSGRDHDDDRLRRGGGEESRERRGESTSKQTSTARYMHEPGRVPTDSADSNSDSDTPVCCHVVSSPRSGVLKLNRVCCMREKRWQQIRGP